MENFRGKISLDKINPLSQSLTNTNFYHQQKKIGNLFYNYANAEK